MHGAIFANDDDEAFREELSNYVVEQRQNRALETSLGLNDQPINILEVRHLKDLLLAALLDNFYNI
jgi:hypothetical protein